MQGHSQGQWPNDHSIAPATLISLSHHGIGASAITKMIEHFLTFDDVYSVAFASLIVVQRSSAAAPQKCSQHDNESLLLEFPINGKFITARAICYEGNLPSGPYFVRDGVIHEAWRLYCDDLDAFEITVVPHVDTNGSKLGSHTSLKLAEI